MLNSDDDARLKQAVADSLTIAEDGIVDDTSPDTEPEWTSLGHLTLMSAVEDAFGVQFSMEEMASAQSYGRLRTLLADRLSASR
jgi:acyl carrier protein